MKAVFLKRTFLLCFKHLKAFFIYRERKVGILSIVILIESKSKLILRFKKVDFDGAINDDLHTYSLLC